MYKHFIRNLNEIKKIIEKTIKQVQILNFNVDNLNNISNLLENGKYQNLITKNFGIIIIKKIRK